MKGDRIMDDRKQSEPTKAPPNPAADNKQVDKVKEQTKQKRRRERDER
jgi:hypothetical protein